MNNIFPFMPKAVAGDWTAGERARLIELAEHLSAKGVALEVAFGQTDAGDPWCVVTDERQEVLVHVARIDGRFVIHDAAVDIIRQVSSLWGAVRQVLVATGADDRGEVVAFNPPGREAQTFLALLIAVGFYIEKQAAGGGAQARWDVEAALSGVRPQTYLPPSALIAALHDGADRLVARPAIAAASAAPDPAAARPAAKPMSDGVAAPLHAAEPVALIAHKAAPWAAPAPAEAPHAIAAALAVPTPQAKGLAAAEKVLNGGPGPDVLIGGPGGEVINGGGGGDYIDGAGAKAGQTDRLNGGAGDDTIVLGPQVVAAGGPGADLFLVPAQPAGGHPGLLGVVVDFTIAQGDQLSFVQGHVAVVSTAAVEDVWIAEGGPAAATASATATPLAGARVGFDFNGDGVEDAFVLLGGADAQAFKRGAAGDTAPGHPIALGHAGSAPVEPALIGHADLSPN